MITNTFVLDERYPDATLTTYLHEYNLEGKPRPAMIVCPGGGYHALTPCEGEPIAMYYASAGMNAFILRYSIGDTAKDFAPLIEAALAIKHVREHAEEYNIDPHKVLIVGFSAGGHLAASSGILWNSKVVRDALGITDEKAPEGINRPDGMILSYPVITGMEKRHANSFRYLTGLMEPTEDERMPFSLEYHVDETTTPAFIWHTFDDKIVPIESALLFMNAMNEHKVPFEAHIFPAGPHGMSLATPEVKSSKEAISAHVASWAKLSVEWAHELLDK